MIELAVGIGIPGIVLLGIGVYDRRFMRIPHSLNMAFFCASWMVRVFLIIRMDEGSPWQYSMRTAFWIDSLRGMLLGFVLMMSAAGLLRGSGIGGGDIRLVTFGGILLGADSILTGVLVGCIFAVPEAINRRRKGVRCFPMGPYLSGGLFLVWAVELCRIRGYL